MTQAAAYLMLQYSKLIRTSDASTSAKLFNYAQYQARAGLESHLNLGLRCAICLILLQFVPKAMSWGQNSLDRTEAQHA